MSIEIDGSEQASRKMKGMAKSLRKISEETLKQVGGEAIEKARSKTPVRTGRLVRGHRMEMLPDKSLRLFNDLEYAGIVEYGSSTRPPRPHWRQAIEWAKKELPRRYAAAVDKTINNSKGHS